MSRSVRRIRTPSPPARRRNAPIDPYETDNDEEWTRDEESRQREERKKAALQEETRMLDLWADELLHQWLSDDAELARMVVLGE